MKKTLSWCSDCKRVFHGGWWGLRRSVQHQYHPSLEQTTMRLDAAAGVGQSYSEIEVQGFNVSNPSLSVSAKYVSVWGMSPPMDSWVSQPSAWLSPLNKVLSLVITGLQDQPGQNQAWKACHQYIWPLYCDLITVFLEPSFLSFFSELPCPWDFPLGMKDLINALLLI